MREKYMTIALEQSKKAFKIEEIPVGAVIVKNDKIIGLGFNKKEKTNDSLMHAEIIAIHEACKNIGDWRLNGCDIYVTLEPCLMCLGAIIESRINNIYCGVTNKKYHEINKQIIKNEKINIEYGIMFSEIDKQLNLFFENIRNKN